MAASVAMVGPSPHETYSAPQIPEMPIETVVLGRMLAAARTTDHSFARNGRKLRIVYAAKSRDLFTPQNVLLTPSVRSKRPDLPLSRLPTLNPKRAQTQAVRIASVDQSRPGLGAAALPDPVLPRVSPSAKSASASQTPPLPARTAPHRSVLRTGLVDLRERHPSFHQRQKPVVLASLQTPAHPRLGEEMILPMPGQSPDGDAETDGLQAALLPDETEARPYIPWAVRQEQAKAFRPGPVHGNPHLAPHVTPFASNHTVGTIIVHVKEKRLYLVESPTTARVYPVGTAHGALDILGRTRVTTRRHMPTWTPTPNQRRRDPTLPRRVEAGPNNPLGIRAIGLGWRYRLIHGTSDPSSIGFARSDGCIRMLNDDVADLFSRVRVGDPVLVLASARSDLTEWRPNGYREYTTRRKYKSRRSYRKKRRYRVARGASRRKASRRSAKRKWRRSRGAGVRPNKTRRIE